MTGLVDWAAGRARMVMAFILLTLVAGMFAYTTLPKEGEPDIEIPALFIAVPFPGISAADAEKMLVEPLEAEVQGLDGLDRMTGFGTEGFAQLVLEFEFGWDRAKTLADVRDAVDKAKAKFPVGYEEPTIDEINFSEFPILIVALSGDLPERTLIRTAKDLQDRIEALPAILEAPLAGDREEMVEVVIDPLRLESYNVTAGELLNAVVNNNQLIAAGDVSTEAGAFAVKIPASFDGPGDIYNLPVKVNGDRVVTLGDLTDIRLTFKDREGTARYNGEPTVALQIVKRKGFNIIDTVALVKDTVREGQASWPPELQTALRVDFAMDKSTEVRDMVGTLQGAVLTAVALVMIVVLAALGTRSALLVGFAIPASFLLCFSFLAIMDVAISNIVMFGLILAVGMLVDGAIVVVEYADKRIQAGVGPMRAYTAAAKRMFWPITASTATTLCAFLPMLFWPGVAGEFMGLLPVTLIFVLSASLLVALIFLPVVGGLAGRISRILQRASVSLRNHVPWLLRLPLFALAGVVAALGAVGTLNPGLLPGPEVTAGFPGSLPGALLFVIGAMGLSVTVTALKPLPRVKPIRGGHRRTPFGHVIQFIVGNPVMPFVMVGAVGTFVYLTFMAFAQNNLGVEFFVDTEPERSIVYIRARGNLSLEEKDALVAEAEQRLLNIPGVDSVFAFAGDGGLDQNTGGAEAPLDTVGQVQLELAPWGTRRPGAEIREDIAAAVATIPGIRTEILEEGTGPASGKDLHLRLRGDDLTALELAADTVRAKFADTTGLIDIDDTTPLPGIDWEIDVDVETAGRFGADVSVVGAMVQLVTRGLLLDTMRVDSSDEEIDIRVRLPEGARLLSTLETLKVRTADGLVPLSNFITVQPVAQLARIDRSEQKRYYDVRANVADGLTRTETLEDGTLREVPINANERITTITDWLETEQPLPPGVEWEWTGDQEDQEESANFLMKGFGGALGLMFVILLTQFNSFYNTVMVLLAVVLSTAGVLIGMMVMQQPFSIIMTGTGIVALAGIVVNNNIVLIDTYQSYARYMPRLEAITRTAEARIRPVLLTTVTTMAGLTPMMLGISIDFINGGYTVDAPAALWWKSLATAVVFGLGTATVLTLVLTPSLLAIRVWVNRGARWVAQEVTAALAHTMSTLGEDHALRRLARARAAPVILWDEEAAGFPPPRERPQPIEIAAGESGPATEDPKPLRAAE
ncbi:MAG TPA: acriflavine resistance protein B [Rhodobacteraceae bacterium]|jgi:multidrug efflux pump|nr:efflux RND transporter permease subunit [Paracoccaceae bacterium]HBG97916.1 acriflavine resistance protein B [Paracoccaceae bacterium]